MLGPPTHPIVAADATYIAAASPDALLALLDALDAAERERDALAALLKDARNALECPYTDHRGWSYGHRCNRCDDEVDNGGALLARIDAALAAREPT